MKASSFLTGLVFAALTAGAAMAQDAPASLPNGDSAIGDWTIHCAPEASLYPCAMYEEVVAKQTRQRILGLSLAFVPSADRHVMMISVPLDISIPKGVVVQTDSFTSPKLPYHHCDRGGCYVQMVIDNASVDAMSHSGAKAAVKIVADNGKPFDLSLSLKGFASAHDKMAELARQKAKTPKPGDTGAAPAPAPTP